jgi:hypothetical protein
VALACAPLCSELSRASSTRAGRLRPQSNGRGSIPPRVSFMPSPASTPRRSTSSRPAAAPFGVGRHPTTISAASASSAVLVRHPIRVEVARRECFAEGADGAGRDPADVATVRAAGVRANGSSARRFCVDRATLETAHAFEHCEVQRFVSLIRLHVQRRLPSLRKLACRSCRDSYRSKDILVWSTGTRTASQAVPPQSGQRKLSCAHVGR